MKNIIFVTLTVLVFVAVLFSLRHRHKKIIEVWKKLARKYHGRFQMIPRKWYQGQRYKMDCELDGTELELSFYVVSHGKSSTTYTRVRTTCDPSLHLSAYQEGVFQKVGKLIGMQDVQTGNDKYDREFMIKSKTPELLKNAFGKELRDAHTDEPSAYLQAEDGTLTVRRTGLISDEDTLLRMLKLAKCAAQNFAAKGGA